MGLPVGVARSFDGVGNPGRNHLARAEIEQIRMTRAGKNAQFLRLPRRLVQPTAKIDRHQIVLLAVEDQDGAVTRPILARLS